MPSPSGSGPQLLFVEIGGSGLGGSVAVELRTSLNSLVAASRSPERFGSNLSQLGAEQRSAGGELEVDRSSISVNWTCEGPCVAMRHSTGTYRMRIQNQGSSARTVDVYAYAIAMTDQNEPNDTPSNATPLPLSSDGDGVSGAIEFVGDVDYYRLQCTGGFGTAARLELISGFAGALALEADGRTYRIGDVTDPIACNTTVAVRTTDGSAGPSDASRYSIVADAASLFDLAVVAQANTTSPTARGSVSLAPGATARVRVTFPNSSAELRFVELGGSGVEGNVRLDLRAGGDVLGVSRRSTLFATSASALAAEQGGSAVSPSSIGVAWQCFGPCVAARYQSGDVVATLTNLSGVTRVVQVLAYGAAASDLNEPNDTQLTATEETFQSPGEGVSGAIEYLGDVDFFRLRCGAQWPFNDLKVTLTSQFQGDIAWAIGTGSTQVYGVGQERSVPCNTVIRVFTRDGTAGPGAASRYSLVVD